MNWSSAAVAAWSALFAVALVIMIGGGTLDALDRYRTRRRHEALDHIAAIMVAVDSSRASIAAELMALPRSVLIDTVRHLNPVVDGESADVLRGLAHAAGVAAMAETRAHARSWRRRIQAADLIALVARDGEPRVNDVQRILLSDRDPRVIARTAQGIDAAGVHRLRHELADLLSHHDEAVTRAAAAALARAPHGLTSVLRPVVARGGRGAKFALAVAGGSGDAELGAWAIGFHDNPDPEIRRQALRCAPSQMSVSAVEIVRWRCGDPDPGVRSAAVWAAGELADPTLLMVMGALLDDDDPKVRIAAGEALAGLGPLGRIALRYARSQMGSKATPIAAHYLQASQQGPQ